MRLDRAWRDRPGDGARPGFRPDPAGRHAAGYRRLRGGQPAPGRQREDAVPHPVGAGRPGQRIPAPLPSASAITWSSRSPATSWSTASNPSSPAPTALAVNRRSPRRRMGTITPAEASPGNTGGSQPSTRPRSITAPASPCRVVNISPCRRGAETDGRAGEAAAQLHARLRQWRDPSLPRVLARRRADGRQIHRQGRLIALSWRKSRPSSRVQICNHDPQADRDDQCSDPARRLPGAIAGLKPAIAFPRPICPAMMSEATIATTGVKPSSHEAKRDLQPVDVRCGQPEDCDLQADPDGQRADERGGNQRPPPP